jgi:hypothetical protein
MRKVLITIAMIAMSAPVHADEAADRRAAARYCSQHYHMAKDRIACWDARIKTAAGPSDNLTNQNPQVDAGYR